MSSIDERVVSMKFDNAQFERGVKQTSNSLSSLKKGFNLDGAKKSLMGLASAGKNFTLGNIGSGVQDIAGRFTNLGIVGVTALANIASKAVDAGLSMAKSLTLDPIMEGLQEYELQLNSIQTILANTQSKGTTLDDVNGALGELNTYADQTIYNFAEMSRNIGTFTAAGVDLDTSTEAIKGIANLAALSGSNSQQASTAMYQLSQAMSSGTVRLMDWNSVVNAGMGGEVFQNALIETAKNQGIQVDDFIKKNGSFRESLQEEWLTTDVMTETLSKFTGDLSTEQLKQMGYTDDQIKEIVKLGETAKDAATKVKTMSQLLDTLKEAVGSGWAQTWQLLFGDFEEAKEVFTAASEALGGIVDQSSQARNDLLGGWKELGGRDVLIESVGNAFQALLAVVAPIKEAFQEIFPPLTAQTLYDMTVALRDFTESLKMGEGTAEKVKRTFAGVFAIIGIGWEIVKGLAGVLLDLFGVVQDGSGGFLDITAGIGDFLVALHKAIKEGDALGIVFDVLGGVIKTIVGIVAGAVGVIVSFAKALGSLFSGGGFDFNLDFIKGFNPLEGILEKIIGRFEGFGKVIQGAISGAKAFGSIINQVWGILAQGDFKGGFFDEDSPIVDILFKIREGLEGFGEFLKEFFSDFDFNTLLDMFNTGLFAGMLLLFQGFFKDIKGIFGGGEGGILESITGIFDGVTGSLEAMQTNLKAGALVKIAGAIALLAAAILVLSFIDSGDLTKSLTAMTVMFGQLSAALWAFEQVSTGPGAAKLPFIAAGLILLSTAILILSAAVKNLSELNWNELTKGLLGVAALLGMLAGWAQIMSKQQGPLIRASLAMILVGAALHILAGAVNKLAELDWAEMGQGLAGVGALLLAVGLFGQFGGGGTIKGALAMVVVGAGLHILAGALKKLAEMDPDQMITSLIGLAGALAVMAGGMKLMTGSLMGAAALVIVSAALWVLTPLLKTMGEMSWNEIAKAATMLAGSLVIIAGAMYLMSGTIAGAASMLVVVAGLWVLVPLLVALGEMTWNEIAKAATMLAGSLIIIAGAMYLMTGIIAGAASMLVVVAALWILVPLLVTMGEMSWEEIGKAATMLAGSLLIIAGGMYLMTGALPGAAALIVVAAALQIMIPVLIALSMLTWEQLLIGLTGLAGAFVVLGLAGLVLAPVIPSLFLLGAAITLLGVGALAAGAGMLAFSVGFTMLAASAAVNGTIIVGMVKQLIGLIPYAAQQLGLGIVALAKVIIGAMPVWTQAMITVLTSIITAINTMAPQIVNTLWNLIMLMASTLQRNVPVLVDKGLQLLLGILRGIRDNIGQIVDVAGQIIVNFVNGISRQMPQITQAGYKLIITFINSLANTIRNNQSQMDAAGKNLASAIISGMTSGLRNGVSRVTSAAKNVASNALNGAKNFLGIKSPSREFMALGKFSDEGFAMGLTRHASLVDKASAGVGSTAMDALKKSVANIGNIVAEDIDMDPTIRPVLDLSSVKKDAGLISGMMGTPKLGADITYGRASSIATMQRNSGSTDDVNPSSAAAAGGNVNFYQYNNSPKALSEVEIYRQTRNQLSAARGAVRT